jgi:hypothetical protein
MDAGDDDPPTTERCPHGFDSAPTLVTARARTPWNQDEAETRALTGAELDELLGAIALT